MEIASQADTTIVVVNPGWGDEVQAAKAGLLEIADIFVVNKADRPGVDATVSDLSAMLDLSGGHGWKPPIVRTVATTGEGVDELWAQIAGTPRVARVERRDRETATGPPGRRAARARGRAAAAAQWRRGVGRAVRRAGRRCRVGNDRSVFRGRRAARRVLSAHPLAVRLADAARGRFPDFDGAVEVVPSPGPPCDALVAFTGHHVLAADVDADEVAARWPPGELSLPFASASLVWLA